MQAEAAAGRDETPAIVEGVFEVRQAAIGAFREGIAFGWALHGQRLVRPFAIELLPEVIESFLLLQGVHAGWPCRFLLEGEVHALVAAILLRVAWLDALDGDSEAQPPDCELAQVEQGIGRGSFYDKQRPELFARALRGAKRELDPKGMMNPGVLIDP